MALFKSGNPTLRESAFEGTILQGITTGEEMSVRGTMNKFGFLFLMMMGTCFFSWSHFYKGGNPMPLLLIGVLAVWPHPLSLIVGDGMIEKGVEARAPKYMEWYGAFGLLVTLVWLYLEILRLLSKLKDR